MMGAEQQFFGFGDARGALEYAHGYYLCFDVSEIEQHRMYGQPHVFRGDGGLAKACYDGGYIGDWGFAPDRHGVTWCVIDRAYVDDLARLGFPKHIAEHMADERNIIIIDEPIGCDVECIRLCEEVEQ